MVCEHACGLTTECARDGLLRSRAFAKGACSRPSCSVPSSVVINVAYTLFKADRHYGRFGTSEEENVGGGGSSCQRASPSDAALGHALR